jgi:hypothetical protein
MQLSSLEWVILLCVIACHLVPLGEKKYILQFKAPGDECVQIFNIASEDFFLLNLKKILSIKFCFDSIFSILKILPHISTLKLFF